jgi:hypothetical protein
LLWLAVAHTSAAQDAPPPEATAAPRQSTSTSGSDTSGTGTSGTITGTVYCADTDLPARLATINLIESAENDFAQEDTTTSDLNGRFTFNRVPEGSYYAVAVLPGYENLMSVMTKSHLDAMTADERKKLLARVSSAAVTANLPGQLAIRMERGAEIDGTVVYDDGGPAIGLHVTVKLKADQVSDGGLQMTSAPPIYSGARPTTTDDRGRFRIPGVLPGEYAVSVSVPVRWAESTDKNPFADMMEASSGAMDVYVGGGQRASKAETIKVTAGGASRDADITIPLSRLHTVRGQVLLKSTNQSPRAATVRLLYADTREPARTMVAPNGEFEFHYVSEGSFILHAASSPELLPQVDSGDGDDSGFGFPAGRFSLSLQPSDDFSESGEEMPLVVTGDMDGVSISVPEPPPSEQEAPNSGAGQSAPSPGDSGNGPQ